MDNEPLPRVGHFSTIVGRHLYVYGGFTESRKHKPAEKVHKYDPSMAKWESIATTGDRPAGVYFGTTVYVPETNSIYTYGGGSIDSNESNGRDEVDEARYQGHLNKLNLDSMEWALIDNNGPIKNAGCRMLLYGNTLVLFGGRAAQLFVDPTRRGTDKVLHTYDINEGIYYKLIFIFFLWICFVKVNGPLLKSPGHPLSPAGAHHSLS